MLKIKQEAGFTLVETILVFSLMAMVLLMGCLGFVKLVPKIRLDGAVQCLVSDFQSTRMKAIGRNCFYRIWIVPEQNQYFIERESMAGNSRWPGVQEGGLRKFDDPDNPVAYPGVTLVSSSNHPVFSPRGTVVGTTITIKNSSGKKIITISSQGRIKVQGG